jgi:hypothetical protein
MEPLSRALPSLDWITLVIILSLLFLAISKRFFYSRFLNFMILPFNNKYIFMYIKKDRLFNSFQVFFTLFQLFNFALFIYQGSVVLTDASINHSLLTYLVILGILLLYYLAKIMVQMGSGYVFNNSRVISELIFKKLSYLNYSGLVMLVANCILAYISQDSKLVVYAAIFLILLINVMGWITLVKNHQKLITNYFFYFILYLCALEIAPLVLIVNALTS